MDTNIDLTPLNFGKFNGKTPSDIALYDPYYIIWLYETLKLCSKELYESCHLETYTQEFEMENEELNNMRNNYNEE